jgi:hypothetical protein
MYHSHILTVQFREQNSSQTQMGFISGDEGKTTVKGFVEQN